MNGLGEAESQGDPNGSSRYLQVSLSRSSDIPLYPIQYMHSTYMSLSPQSALRDSSLASRLSGVLRSVMARVDCRKAASEGLAASDPPVAKPHCGSPRAGLGASVSLMRPAWPSGPSDWAVDRRQQYKTLGMTKAMGMSNVVTSHLGCSTLCRRG